MTADDVKAIPPWVRSLLVHVVKRCCAIVIKWIDDMQEAEKSLPQ